MNARWVLVVTCALCLAACGPSREERVKRLESMMSGNSPARPLDEKDVALLKEMGRGERRAPVVDWCVTQLQVSTCRDLLTELLAAGDVEAHRAVARHICRGGGAYPASFWQRKELAIRSVLEQGSECRRGLNSVKLDDVLPLLTDEQALESARPMVTALLPSGVECPKSLAMLEGEATPSRKLLARLLVSGPCSSVLTELAVVAHPVLARYRDVVELELSGTPVTWAQVIRRAEAYGLVKKHAAQFSPALAGKLVEAIRAATGVTAVPTAEEVRALATLVEDGGPIAEAVLNVLAARSPEWKTPAGSLDKSGYRAHLTGLHRLAALAERKGRTAVAVTLRGLVEPAFRAEIEAIAKKPADQIAAFINSSVENPLGGELIARLDSQGRPAVGVVVEGQEAASFVAEVRSKIEAAVGAKGLVVRCPDAKTCTGLQQRVHARVAVSKTGYCYDKHQLFGACLTPGQRVTLTLTYYEGQQVAGRDSVSAETPKTVTYRTFSGFDSGPSSSDVWSATTGALSERLTNAKLTLPY